MRQLLICCFLLLTSLVVALDAKETVKGEIVNPVYGDEPRKVLPKEETLSESFDSGDYYLRASDSSLDECYDMILNAPGTVTGTTLGAGNDCTYRSSEDIIVKVVIPNNGFWSFSLCGSSFDTYLFLSYDCCSNLFKYNNDGCEGTTQSLIDCYEIAAGEYYANIEGRVTAEVGEFVLEVWECPNPIGRCCYSWGDYDPATGHNLCDNLTQRDCETIGGDFSEFETCQSAPCNSELYCDHLPDGITQEGNVYTFRQTVDATSGPDLYLGPWDSGGSHYYLINQSYYPPDTVYNGYGGFNNLCFRDQDFSWFHTFPDWNTSGLNIHSITIEICAHDVDWSSGEWNVLWINNTLQTPNMLYGSDSAFETTKFHLTTPQFSSNGVFEMFLDLDSYEGYDFWGAYISWSQLEVVYSFDQQNQQPYTPACVTLVCENATTDDVCISATEPFPADPDGDDVTYDFIWYVKERRSPDFISVASHPTRNLSHINGPCVPHEDLQYRDTWRALIFAMDEHNTRSEEAFVLDFYYSGGSNLTYYTNYSIKMEELNLNQSYCVPVCSDIPVNLRIGPLGSRDGPSAWTITPGCSSTDSNYTPDCEPADATMRSYWTYDDQTKQFCAIFGSSTSGCFSFKLDYVLPVELLSFNATPGDREVKLNWSTASETNSDRFEILRNGTLVGRVSADDSPSGSSYHWTDRYLNNGTEYTYNLIEIDLDGTRSELATVSAMPTFVAAEITEFALHQNYPNPFNPATSITFDIAETGFVNLTVFNSLGQTMATLVNTEMPVGRHSVEFNAEALPSGLYFYRMTAGEFHAVNKMILMK